MLRAVAILSFCLLAKLAAADPVMITSMTRYASNPILPYTNWSFTTPGQVAEACIIVDPNNSSQLLMYFTAFPTVPPASFSLDHPVIWRITGTVANPQGGWNLSSNIVALPLGAAGTFDEKGIRLGSCFVQGSTVYLYYTGYNNSFNNVIGMATSTDGGVTFTKYAGNPILTPTGQGRTDGTDVMNAAVIVDSGTYYLLYGYCTGTGGCSGGQVLPGYRYATSSNGTTFTKGGTGDIWTCAPTTCEAHRVRKFGNTFLQLYEEGDPSTNWHIVLLEAPTPIGPYTSYTGNPILTHGAAGTWDQYHVATPDFYFASNGAVFLTFQGGGDVFQPYGNNHWSIGIAAVTLGGYPAAGFGGPGARR
jgi:hypothetical protein